MVSNYQNILAAKEAYRDGRNVIEFLRSEDPSGKVVESGIEISYDLQAGTYVNAAQSDPCAWRSYGAEIRRHLEGNLFQGASILDCGAGELTTLASLQQAKKVEAQFSAMDLSWSRLSVGRRFYMEQSPTLTLPLLFTGEMSQLPLADNSVDHVLTIHSLEPNGGYEDIIITELLRVVRTNLILFEPCYERASPAAQARMEAHGYVKGLENRITSLGGTLTDVVKFDNPINPLNPTWVIIAEPQSQLRPMKTQITLACPITKDALECVGSWFVNRKAGIAYPSLAGIPLLRPRSAVLVSDLEGLIDFPGRDGHA